MKEQEVPRRSLGAPRRLIEPKPTRIQPKSNRIESKSSRIELKSSKINLVPNLQLDYLLGETGVKLKVAAVNKLDIKIKMLLKEEEKHPIQKLKKGPYKKKKVNSEHSGLKDASTSDTS